MTRFRAGFRSVRCGFGPSSALPLPLSSSAISAAHHVAGAPREAPHLCLLSRRPALLLTLAGRPTDGRVWDDPVLIGRSPVPPPLSLFACGCGTGRGRRPPPALNASLSGPTGRRPEWGRPGVHQPPLTGSPPVLAPPPSPSFSGVCVWQGWGNHPPLRDPSAPEKGLRPL